MDPISYGSALSAFITLELNARIAGFESARQALDQEISLWHVGSSQSAVPDHIHSVVTNVLMRSKGEITRFDWSTIAGTNPTESIAVTVPAVVVAELDDLKHSNGKMIFGGQSHERKWLATLALGWLERTFSGDAQRVVVREPHGAGQELRPRLYAVLQSDPLDHIALPKADSEIIDNAVQLVPLAKTVTLASYDAHMVFTARHLGLRAYKLPEEEPD